MERIRKHHPDPTPPVGVTGHKEKSRHRIERAAPRTSSALPAGSERIQKPLAINSPDSISGSTETPRDHSDARAINRIIRSLLRTGASEPTLHLNSVRAQLSDLGITDRKDVQRILQLVEERSVENGGSVVYESARGGGWVRMSGDLNALAQAFPEPPEEPSVSVTQDRAGINKEAGLRGFELFKKALEQKIRRRSETSDTDADIRLVVNNQIKVITWELGTQVLLNLAYLLSESDSHLVASLYRINPFLLARSVIPQGVMPSLKEATDEWKAFSLLMAGEAARSLLRIATDSDVTSTNPSLSSAINTLRRERITESQMLLFLRDTADFETESVSFARKDASLKYTKNDPHHGKLRL